MRAEKGDIKKSGESRESLLDKLSSMERRVVSIASFGFPMSDIATMLHLSPKTIEAHLTNARRKTGAKNTAHLIGMVGRSSSLEHAPEVDGQEEQEVELVDDAMDYTPGAGP